MKKKSILLLLVFSFLSIGIAKGQNQDTIVTPDEKIKVNREYDEDGNLIRYDSIYSYSSGNWNLSNKNMDSIMKHFFSDREGMSFPSPFEMHDFIFPDPFSNNFDNMDSIFGQRFEEHQKRMDSLFQHYRPKKENPPENKM